MTEELAHAQHFNLAENQKDTVGNPAKKKVSWLRTILWMISMVLLANVAMGVIAYLLFANK